MQIFPVQYTECFSAENNKCPRYDTNHSGGEFHVMLKLWEIRGTHSLLSLKGILCPGVVALDRVISMGEIELNRVTEFF